MKVCFLALRYLRSPTLQVFLSNRGKVLEMRRYSLFLSCRPRISVSTPLSYFLLVKAQQYTFLYMSTFHAELVELHIFSTLSVQLPRHHVDASYVLLSFINAGPFFQWRDLHQLFSLEIQDKFSCATLAPF